MNLEAYIKQQQKRSKPGEYKSVRPRLRDAIDWLKSKLPGGFKNLSCLDVGTRDGWALDHLMELGARPPQGVELVPDTADYAKGRGRNVICADMQHLPHREMLFDLVTAIHSLEHVPTPRTALSEMIRVVKPGGWIYIVVPKQEYKPGKDRCHNVFFSTMGQVVALCCGHSLLDSGEMSREESILVDSRGKKSIELRVLVQRRTA